MRLSLSDFRATRIFEEKDAEWCQSCGYSSLTSQKVVEYCSGSCHILVLEDGEYSLVIGSEEWCSNDLAGLELRLYEDWYMRESADPTRETEDTLNRGAEPEAAA